MRSNYDAALQYVSRDSLYYDDYAFLKKMGNCYKLVKCNSVRRSGYEVAGKKKKTDGIWVGNWRKGKFLSKTDTFLDYSISYNENINIRKYTNDEKLKNNIIRARNRIIEYGLCNDFEYFCTFTLDQKKYDRYDLDNYIHHLGIFIQNINARTTSNIKYLLIPELHKNGAWHLHGFFMGIDESLLRKFKKSDREKLPRFILDGIDKGRQLYDFPKYRKQFGYCCLEPIESKIGATMYMCKYMSKEIASNVRSLGSHLYYCSKGLNKAEVVAKGQWLDNNFKFDYVHKFGSISFYENLDDTTLEYIKDRIGSDPITIDDRRRGYREDADGWKYIYDPDTGEIFGDIEKAACINYVPKFKKEGECDEFVNRDFPSSGKCLPDDKKCFVSAKKVASASELHPEAGAGGSFKQLCLGDFYLND